MIIETKITMQSIIAFIAGEMVKVPIENAIDAEGNPISAFYEKRGFDTYTITMGEKTLTLKELNILWFSLPEHFSQYFGIRTLGNDRYLFMEWDSYSIVQNDSRIKTVHKFILDIFGVDIEQISVE